MTKWTTTVLTTLILLISMLLIGVTVADVITDGTSDSTTESDIDQMVQQIEDEISTYIQIKDIKGKYIQNQIERIAILISPMVTQQINMTDLSIQIDNGEYVRILTHQGQAEKIESNSLFQHNVWNNITQDYYGIISIVDLDSSIDRYSIINENTDNAYIIIKLPDNMKMEKYDTITLTLFPSTGITRTINLKAPMPMKTIITFE